MTDPVVEDNPRRVRYEVTNPAGQATFVITFPVVTLDDGVTVTYGISVYIDDALADPGDYTVDLDAGTVALDTPAAEGAIVVLEGSTPPVRLLAYALRGGPPSARLNQEFNSVYYLVQELLRDRSRSMVLAPSAPSAVSGRLPPPLPGLVLRWNAAGDALENTAVDLATLEAATLALAAIAANIVSLDAVSNDIPTLAAITSEIGTVANDSFDIIAVANISTEVANVSSKSAAVEAVSAIDGEVVTVAGIAADVTSVAGVAAGVTTVAGIAADVTAVAGIAADVTTCATNIAAIQAAPTAAGDAQSARDDAEDARDIATAASRPQPDDESGTTDTLALADENKVKRYTNGSAITVTVPKNSVVAFPVGTRIFIEQAGDGQITISPVDGDVTLESKYSRLKSEAKFAMITLYKRATDTWIVSGELAP